MIKKVRFIKKMDKVKGQVPVLCQIRFIEEILAGWKMGDATDVSRFHCFGAVCKL